LIRAWPCRRAISAVAVVLVTLAAAFALPAAASAAPERAYIVQLRAEPLATYDGGVAGIPATSPPAPDAKLDVETPAARSYSDYLATRSDGVLARLPGAQEVLQRFDTTVAGFATRLTPAEAKRLRGAAEVLNVTRSRRLELTASPVDDPARFLGNESPNFLGLPTGAWRRLGGANGAGAGIVVGVIDGGIHPENPSFADRPVQGGRRLFWGDPYGPPQGFRGRCQGGEHWSPSTCNNKLVGARFFVEGYGAENVHERDFLSPRDSDGHGSHTASTAAGNFGVDPTVFGNGLGVDLISGIAPRAYISHYKAFWNGKDGTVGEASDIDVVAAIDRAVADRVDVINASFSGGASFGGSSPTGVAFLRAARAGVFVAEAAGNEGPGPETIADAADAPWVTTVAASTTARTFTSRMRLRDGQGAPPAPLTLQGLSFTPELSEVPLVDGATAAAPGVPAEDAELCLPGSLRRQRVAGRAVLCKRGVSFIAEKSKEVARVGGKGLVLYNPTPESDHDFGDGIERHWVPSVHVRHAQGLAVKQFIATAGQPLLRLDAAQASPTQGDVVTDFSSRGPQEAVPSILKPDVAAPGVNILAAFSPVQADQFYPGGDIFSVWQGTSMSSPHVAGAGALLADLHPTWSPMEIKSALMTTAVTAVTDNDGDRADPFEIGGGRIDPTRAADPGLVLNETPGRFHRYLEGIDPEFTPGNRNALAPSELNVASIGFSELLGAASASRTFRSVDPGRTSWRIAFEGLGGISASAEATTFSLAGGDSRKLTFRFARTTAPLGEWTFGAVLLTETGGSGRRVRLPVAIRPVALSAPPNVEAAAAAPSGSQPVRVRVGFDGVLSAQGFGLAAPNVATGQTIQTTTGAPSLEPDAGSRLYPVTVEPGTQAIAGEISNLDGGAPTSDLDLYLYYDDESDGFDDGDLFADSVTFSPTERLAVPDPEPGDYLWVVVGFTTAEPNSVYDFSTWRLRDPSPDDPSNAPGLSVGGDPAAARQGSEVQLSLDWSGVTAPGRYLGLVTYHDAGTPAPGNRISESLVWLDR